MTPKTGTPLDDISDEEIVAAARARYWQDRADAAKVSAWSLWFLSLVALGAALTAIHNGDMFDAAGLTLVMVLLAWAAGSERREQRACEWEAR